MLDKYKSWGSKWTGKDQKLLGLNIMQYKYGGYPTPFGLVPVARDPRVAHISAGGSRSAKRGVLRVSLLNGFR